MQFFRVTQPLSVSMPVFLLRLLSLSLFSSSCVARYRLFPSSLKAQKESRDGIEDEQKRERESEHMTLIEHFVCQVKRREYAILLHGVRRYAVSK